MRYKDAPSDYPYLPSQYIPDPAKVVAMMAQDRCDKQTAIIMLKGGAAACFLNDFPKTENPELSHERALAIANLGAAQLQAQKVL
jgi:hypothetical protein